MIMKEPEALGFDPKTYVIWDWNYWDGDTIPKTVNFHALGHFSQENIGKSSILKKFPEVVDGKGRLRAFGSVQVLKKYGFEVILCSSSRSHGDTFFCPHPMHAANITGAAKTVASENLLGHCVTSWAIRLNDFTTQIPSIGLATYAQGRPEKSSEALLSGYCRELFGTDPAKFIAAIKLLGVSLPFAQSATTSVQWNGMKDSLPAPKGYLKKYLASLKKTNPTFHPWFLENIKKAARDVPEGIRLLSEFFSEAKKGFDIIEAWLAGAYFLNSSARVAPWLIQSSKNPVLAALLENDKHEFEAFLRRRETPLSAAKNAGLAYDTLIESLAGSL